MTFAGGKDVFGRPPKCRACHGMLHNLENSLVPTLRALNESEWKRKHDISNSASRRVDFGKIESLIDTHIEKACYFSSTFHFKDMKK